MKGTGGGPSQCVPLSELENRLFNLLGTVAVEGDNVAEMGFGQVTVNQFLEPSVDVVTSEAAGRSELTSSSRGLKRPMEPNLDHDYTAETSGGSSRSSSAVKRQVPNLNHLGGLDYSGKGVFATGLLTCLRRL
ncbi:uncharacterized protein LOC115877246 [Sitophilus oryzae]|uniref:Uncharacterized protein LOC115877246 n=1 Tax=Sitophilus oryzae TaxID=7048 RepID=A0A6J2XDE3_SITOR|nr:uncharacterized protein LOC115877246 [Sitophilus oryzae]